MGYKPTKDLIPSEGTIYASKKQDTVRVPTSTVQDAAQVTSAIIAHSSQRTSSKNLPDCEQRAFLNELTTSTSPQVDLRGVQIDIPLDLIKFHDPPDSKLEALGRALFRLEAKGARVDNKITIPGWREYEALSQEEKQVVLDTDMKMAINDYLTALDIRPRTSRVSKIWLISLKNVWQKDILCATWQAWSERRPQIQAVNCIGQC